MAMGLDLNIAEYINMSNDYSKINQNGSLVVSELCKNSVKLILDHIIPIQNKGIIMKNNQGGIDCFKCMIEAGRIRDKEECFEDLTIEGWFIKVKNRAQSGTFITNTMQQVLQSGSQDPRGHLDWT